MHADDDSYIRLDLLLRWLDSPVATPWRGLYAGYIWDGRDGRKTKPLRDPTAKSYVPFEQWPHDSYPPFASGCGFLIACASASDPLALRLACDAAKRAPPDERRPTSVLGSRAAPATISSSRSSTTRLASPFCASSMCRSASTSHSSRPTGCASCTCPRYAASRVRHGATDTARSTRRAYTDPRPAALAQVRPYRPLPLFVKDTIVQHYMQPEEFPQFHARALEAAAESQGGTDAEAPVPDAAALVYDLFVKAKVMRR